MINRVLAATLCLMLAFALLSMPAHADRETGHNISTSNLTIGAGDGDCIITGTTTANTITVTGGMYKIILDG